MPRKVDPTEEQMHEDTDNLIAELDGYFTKYYGPRCKEYEKDCPVCEVWKLYDQIQVWIR